MRFRSISKSFKRIAPLPAAVLACAWWLAAGAPPGGPPSPDGEALARVYCASCHAFPEPALLGRDAWAAVLPDMGGRLGVYTTVPRDSLVRRVDQAHLDPARVYPTAPALPVEEWQAIVDYFMREAPEAVSLPPREAPVAAGLPGFRTLVPPSRFEPPFTTMVSIQARNRLFFLGNYGPNSTLLVIDAQGQPRFDWALPGAPVAAHWDGGRLLILLIGPGPEPTEAAAGSVVAVDGPDAPVRTVLSGLRRPVDLDVGDLNGDGRDDLVVCEYGNETGQLAWYETAADGTYRRHVLSEQPGAVSAALHDFDGDGRLDVGVLMAQGDEGFDVYRNTGDGRFEPRRVLRFPPVYGSNHFELADFNGDGIADILYANGDNADVTPVLKPFHGVRIFVGAPDGTFDEAYFFPLPGARAARAADFDGDGDLDIAAISYFPDYAHAPEESFVLLENEGNFTFTARTFEDSQRGRRLVMDVGDLDGDGDPDVLLGSNIGFGPDGDATGLFERWLREAPSVLLLENTR